MKPHFREILHAPAERLGLFRAAVGAFTVAYLMVRAPSFYGTSRSSSGEYVPVGLLAWLRGFGQSVLGSEQFCAAPIESSVAVALYGLCMIAGVAFTLGAYLQVTAPAFALLLLFVTSYKSSFGMLFHSENLFTLQVLVLAFAGSGRAFSFDARLAPQGTTVARSVPPGLPLLFAALIAITSYFVAGVAKWKLSGMDWLSGDVLRVQVAYDNLRKIELGSWHSPLGAWLVQYPWVFRPLGALTLLAEFCGILALFHRRIALIWTLLIIGFHFGVLALMAIAFAYPLTGIPFLCLFPLERSRLGKWLLARAAPRSEGAELSVSTLRDSAQHASA